MPIYSYRCESCGFGKDVLQKLSDVPLTRCPECGAETFRKQVTAAGFQLKGSGWYVTDFRSGGNSNASNASNASEKNGNSNGDGSSAGASPEGGKSGSADASGGTTEATSSAPSTSAAAPAASGGASSS
ncbi:FmdB family zinc ribbon protein [Paraburkholderia humisilvae]|uniref:Putative regulatory protein FmdB zinc ribbon domain-containing protein n=1 Tax=Paraburkholderia humisilvae TaxID=627669 RepID=A0A6J5DYD0_9BURK|nr:zinc ribbon domain-containing protein [Paraburkholderia humisilvae]CAB3757986.1 hypothetical protein LMG29542_03219 [Paraburkholderia humisilvae]